MRATVFFIVALSGVAFAAPEFYLTDKSEPFKDLTSLHYQQNLPVPEMLASNERRETEEPVKDNRNLHYNSNTRMPLAIAVPERREVEAESQKAPKPVKDNRNLHYNSNRMPIAMASPNDS